MTLERFKDSLKGKNRNQLFNIRHQLKEELFKAELVRKRPNREKGDNMKIQNCRKKIAIIESITNDLIRTDKFYYKEGQIPKGDV